jgi:hypothetical protein
MPLIRNLREHRFFPFLQARFLISEFETKKTFGQGQKKNCSLSASFLLCEFLITGVYCIKNVIIVFVPTLVGVVYWIQFVVNSCRC